jgi:hypothetical protein
MKYSKFLIFIFCGIISVTFSQEITLGNYKWKESVLLTVCDINGVKDTDFLEPRLSMRGQKFKVVKVDSNKVVLKVFKYNDIKTYFKKLDTTGKWVKTCKCKSDSVSVERSSNFYRYNYKRSDQEALAPKQTEDYDDYGKNTMYFYVDSKTLNSYAIKDERVDFGLSVGVINFPFKYRPQKGLGDFSGTFNFGAGLGVKMRHKSYRKFTWSIITGYSISNLVIDSVSATRNSKDLVSTNNFSAFSFSIGPMIEYDKVQVGMFVGWDRLSKLNQEKYGWKYQGKPWLSIAFGYAIFTNEKVKESVSEKNNENP